MSDHSEAVEHVGGSTVTFAYVWIALLVMTAIEVFLAYEELKPAVMLSILVVLSCVKAGMIMSWFMHLKYEKFSLVLWLVPAMIFCICMMFIFFFPEAFRLVQMRPH